MLRVISKHAVGVIMNWVGRSIIWLCIGLHPFLSSSLESLEGGASKLKQGLRQSIENAIGAVNSVNYDSPSFEVHFPLLDLTWGLDLQGGGSGTPFDPFEEKKTYIKEISSGKEVDISIAFDRSYLGARVVTNILGSGGASTSPILGFFGGKSAFYPFLKDVFNEFKRDHEESAEEEEVYIKTLTKQEKKKGFLDEVFEPLSFTVTPGWLFIFKTALLLKSLLEEEVDEVRAYEYSLEFGTLCIRLALSSIGIEDEKPFFDSLPKGVQEVLKEISQNVAPFFLGDRNINTAELQNFLPHKINWFWDQIVRGGGIVITPEGALQRTGIGIHAFNCNNAELAQSIYDSLQAVNDWGKFSKSQLYDDTIALVERAIRIHILKTLSKEREEAEKSLPKGQTLAPLTSEELEEKVKESPLLKQFIEESSYSYYGRIVKSEDLDVLPSDVQPVLKQFIKEEKLEFPGHYYLHNSTLFLFSKRLTLTEGAQLAARIFFKTFWEYIKIIKSNHKDLFKRLRTENDELKKAHAYFKSSAGNAVEERSYASFGKKIFGDKKSSPTVAVIGDDIVIGKRLKDLAGGVQKAQQLFYEKIENEIQAMVSPTPLPLKERAKKKKGKGATISTKEKKKEGDDKKQHEAEPSAPPVDEDEKSKTASPA